MTASPPAAHRCRVCGHLLFPDPLLRYSNMPAVAQHLPDAQTLGQDKGVDLEIFVCSGCGLVQLVIEPVHYYREVIRAAGVSSEMTEFRARQFEDFVREHKLAGKSVIEVGSGRGEYLSLMARQGVAAQGLEHSRASVQHSIENGLQVVQGFIEDEHYKIAAAPFDAFFMISFFEHLPDPNRVLRGIYGNLRDGAVGLVEVPNFDMMLRDHLFSEFMRDHLFYFTARSLATTLELNGFEVMRIEEIWHKYILSAVVKKRQRVNMASFMEYEERIRTELDSFVSRFSRVAIWGAGHQALAIMAMMNLGGRIQYVVDAAQFKQGKFTPASHIPIVAPQTLHSEPVDAVIIMAGSYSDEIKRIMKEKFGDITTAVLRPFGLEMT